MATSPYSGSAEVKRREKKDDVRSGGRVVVGAGAPAVSGTEDERCTCCPFGYHIDLDFLNFCNSVSNGSTLTNLKRIQRTKRKLRKSMELMLQQQQHGRDEDDGGAQQESPSSLPSPGPAPALPPDVVHSTESSRLMHMVSYERSATSEILQDIDSAVSATLASIDSMQRSGTASKSYASQRRYQSTDSEDSFRYSPITPLTAPPSSQATFTFDPTHPPVPPPRRSSLRYAHHNETSVDDPEAGRKDSVSSVSSVSTVSSEHGGHSSALAAESNFSSTATGRQFAQGGTYPHLSMTSESLATAMASHFPEREGEEEGSPMSPNTTISKASLAAIRAAMATSLHRLRDMEEQVRAIPILQVRISVLKEEKRLLALQLKARSGTSGIGASVRTRSVAVGVDLPTASPASAGVPLRSALKTPLPRTLPKPARVKVDAGVGDHSVEESYLLQPGLPTGHSPNDHQVQNKMRSKLEEKKSSQPDDDMEAEHHVPVHSIRNTQQAAPKPKTRSIGVGESDVNAQTLQIHNTEIRTVILGTSNSAVGKRNVGVECKVPSRSVGVSVTSRDSASPPSTRTIGVNVTSENFATRAESELSTAVQKALQREVRTVGTHCNVRPSLVDAGVQHEPDGMVSVGCGREEGDTAVTTTHPPPVQRCSAGVMVRPDTCDRSVSPEKDWMRDVQTDALTVETCDRSLNTDSRPTGSISTSTDLVSSAMSASQTEVGVFEKMEAISSTGSNTTSIPTTTSSSNTPPTPDTAHAGTNTTTTPAADDDDHSSRKAGGSVEAGVRDYRDAGVNTASRQPRLSLSKVECVEIAGEGAPTASPRRPRTMQEHILQRGAEQAFAFLGSTSSSGSLSPTSPKRLTDDARETEQTEGASAGADQSRFASSRTAVEVTESFSGKEGVCLLASSKQGQVVVEGRGLEEEKKQDESLTLPEHPSGEASLRGHQGSAEKSTKPTPSIRTTRHRDSDGMKISQELDAANRPGIFSGQRVGSVEDFMPDEMRRLMNLDTVSPETKPRASSSSSSSSRSVKVFSKTTVTTVHTSEERSSQASSLTEITTTTRAADSGSEVAATEEEDNSDDQESCPPQKPDLGQLSVGQLDLSQIAAADSDPVVQGGDADDESGSSESEGGGIKDSGYYDSSTGSGALEAGSMQGVDFSSMGSLERRELKSIMKTSKSDTPIRKKGISFADSVVGGTGFSSEEEGTESDEDSSTSYDEGSYDSREGDITYQCQDDEAIAQGLPGAQMYDQNIRETYELSKDMRKSCQVLANFLVDSTTIQSKELNANLCVVQEEWFRVSSHKLSSAHQVEDYLSSIKEISHRLLEYIVNLMDDNGNAAIHYCVSHCSFEIVGLLLDTEVCDVQKGNKAGYTPVMLASLAFIQNDEHRDVILQLFAAGNVNARAEKTGQTALMLATSQARADMVELLIQTGADINLQDFDGSTALMVACEHGHDAIVHLLLAQPACDATLTDNENSTALSIAMEAKHKDIGVILYKHLNFHGPGVHRKRKGSSSPTPRYLVH